VGGRSQYTAVRATADYINRGVSQVFALSFTGTLGLDGTRSATAGALDPKTDFKAALLQMSYARRLNAKNLELRARMAVQSANGPLYSGERFSAGGQNSVRGYRENLLLADEGAFASVELAQPFDLSGGRKGAGGLDWGAVTVSGFLDGARVGDDHGPDPSPRAIASVGASLAWTPSDAIFARVTYADALKKAPLVGRRDIQDRGFQFQVTVHPLGWLRSR
jgi:hemolysin activation/secretion protein